MEYLAPLHDYQKLAVDKVLNEGYVGLFLEPGLGKTLTTLEIIHQLYEKYERVPALIVAPKTICDHVWPDEIEKWGHGFSMAVLSGDHTPKRRMKILEGEQADITLITPDLLVWLETTGIFPYKIIAIDELTKFKSSGSGRWKAFKKLLAKRKCLVLGLTGTPCPNGLPDLWSQMYLLDKGESLGKFKTHFLEDHFIDVSPDPRRYSNYVPRRGSEKAIWQKLRSGGVMAMTAKDVLGQQAPIILPSIRFNLEGPAKKIYKELETELMATMPDGTIVLPEHDCVISLKLRQVSSGFMIDDDKKVHTLHHKKARALEEHVESLNGEPVMCVYSYNAELEDVRKVIKNVPALAGGVSKAQRIKTIAAWNAGEVPLLMVQPQAAGHGVNLQEGGHRVLFYSAGYDLELYDQVVARLNRQGQKSPVFIQHMVCGAIEDDIYLKLAVKSLKQSTTMDNLK